MVKWFVVYYPWRLSKKKTHSECCFGPCVILCIQKIFVVSDEQYYICVVFCEVLIDIPATLAMQIRISSLKKKTINFLRAIANSMLLGKIVHTPDIEFDIHARYIHVQWAI